MEPSTRTYTNPQHVVQSEEAQAEPEQRDDRADVGDELGTPTQRHGTRNPINVAAVASAATTIETRPRGEHELQVLPGRGRDDDRQEPETRDREQADHRGRRGCSV